MDLIAFACNAKLMVDIFLAQTELCGVITDGCHDGHDQSQNINLYNLTIPISEMSGNSHYV